MTRAELTMNYLYRGIPSSLPHLAADNSAPTAGVWSDHAHRLPWIAAKEGDLIKSSFLKFLLAQPAKRERVVRTTMVPGPERWNEDIGTNIRNAEAVLVQIVGRVVEVRCDYCLAGRGIFPLCVVIDEPGFPKCCGNCLYGGKGGRCTILQHGQPQQGYHPAAATGSPHANPTPRLQAELLSIFNRLGAQHEQLSVLQSRQSTAVAEHQSAAQSASVALEDVMSRVNQSLPVRRTDVVRCRDTITAAIRTAARVESTIEAVASHPDTMKGYLHSFEVSPAVSQLFYKYPFSPVKWKGKQYTLSGRPDYGICYGDEEDIELNVVIVEAKRPMGGSQGIPQALAYMGNYISISLLEPLLG
jgi:hypothetical protein